MRTTRAFLMICGTILLASGWVRSQTPDKPASARKPMELTAKLLAPQRVRLNLKNATVAEAVAELAKQAGHPIHLRDTASRTTTRVTLDTGDTTFWDAFERLCQEAGLIEDEAVMGPFGDFKDGRPLSNSANIMTAPAGMHLTAGKAQSLPTVVAGSVRVRLVKTALSPGAVDLFLEVSGESRLRGLEPAAPIQITRSIGGQGQQLPWAASSSPNSPKESSARKLLGHRGGRWVVILTDDTAIKGNCFGPASPVAEGPFVATVRLQRKDPRVKSLQELSGRLKLQTSVVSDKPLVIDHIRAAGAQSVKTGEGVAVKVVRVEQLPNNNWRVQAAWERHHQALRPGSKGAAGRYKASFGSQALINGSDRHGSPDTLTDAPRLVDSDGGSLPLIEWISDGWNVTYGQMIHRVRLVYRPQPGQAAPAQLVWVGQQTSEFEVPFTFKDIVLP